MHARNLKLVIEYDGTDFAGWQVQPGRRTVQGVLEEAFSDLAGEVISVTGAGRTDAGVHALGQVAHVRTALKLPAERIAAAVNARLADDVFVRNVTDAPESFHARYDAVARSYFYLIGATKSPLWRRHRWYVSEPLDVGAMQDAASALEGEHDFSSFCLSGSDPGHHRCHVRRLSIEWEDRYGGVVVIRMEANRFLRGMVRSVVGTLVDVGKRKVSADRLREILEAEDRSRAGPTAPPHGLYLAEVKYEEGV